MADTNADNPNHMQAMLRPIFDSHQEFGPRFEASFDEFKSKNPNSSKFLWPPIFENEQTYLCLQAADLFTYEMRRTVSNHFFDPKRDLRVAAGRLFPQINRSFVVDYAALETLAGWQERDEVIPISPIEDGGNGLLT